LRAYLLVMALPLSSPDELPATLPARKIGRAVAIAGLVSGFFVIVAALALWSRYGTAVFFETIMAGVAGCF
jgi:hypothetical protein